MKDTIKIDTGLMLQYADQISAIEEKLDDLNTSLNALRLKANLSDWPTTVPSGSLRSPRWRLSRTASCLRETAKDMQSAEEKIIKEEPLNFKYGKIKVFIDELRKAYGWNGFLKNFGDIGEIYDWFQGRGNGDDFCKNVKTGLQGYLVLSEIVRKYKNYKRIGRMVGAKKAGSQFLKKITGLNNIGYVSKTKKPLKPFNRFLNNLKNDTSPFRKEMDEVLDTFKGKKGVGKAVAVWGTVFIDGVINWRNNKDEQAQSGGTMSDGRVVAETIMETAVGTALTYGSGIVVGAAISAITGVAAPAVAVAAVSGLAITAIDAGVKAVTQKSTTEWISDSLLSGGEKIGSMAKNVGKSMAKWFRKGALA